jgi:hypothetical protein
MYKLAPAQAEVNKGETTAQLIVLGIDPEEPGAYLCASEETRRLRALEMEKLGSTRQIKLY